MKYIKNIIKCLILSAATFSLSAYDKHAKNTSNLDFVEEGFVTFATKNYFPLLQVLLDSVHYFSTRPIIVYGINDDIPFTSQQYPHMIKRRMDLNLKKESIYYAKPQIILDSDIKYGVYVEADDILNEGVDSLFTTCRTIEQFPICPIHPQDPNNQLPIMQALRVNKKTMPYVHAHFLFSESCKPFIKEWYDTCLTCHPLKPANWDETILNVLLWKHENTKSIEIYDPSYPILDYLLVGKPYPSYQKFYPDHLHYYMLHGCKDPGLAKKILNKLIVLHENKNGISIFSKSTIGQLNLYTN